jgi:uncharacterized protein
VTKKVKMDEELPQERIRFYGHENVLANHYNTIEITTEENISMRADCIIGVRASKACNQLESSLKTHIRNSGLLGLVILVGELSFRFNGSGSPELDLADSREIVLRKSRFISGRTAALSCDAAARDIPREMVRLLQDPEQAGYLEIRAVGGSPKP